MAERIRAKGMDVILIQIDEAHSSGWPVGLEDQPEPHKDFSERIARANQFVEEYKPPYKVLVDTWDNEFGETFHAWPDKYVCVDRDKKVTHVSEYGRYGKEGKL